MKKERGRVVSYPFLGKATWDFWEQGEMETHIDQKKRTVKHKLLMPDGNGQEN